MSEEPKKDFFVSRAGPDAEWAAWIAWIIEDEFRCTTILQQWDFRGDFVLEMDRAVKGSKRTVVVLSPDYLTRDFTQPEWAGAFREDPRGLDGKLIVFRVRDCKPDGLLGSIPYEDLIGRSKEECRRRIRDKIRLAMGERLKPTEEPVFPGSPPQKPEPSFPGAPPPAIPPNPIVFVGRREEVERLVATLLASDRHRFALYGPAGMGKSTVAVRALHDPRSIAAFGSRRWFVRLDATSAAEATQQAIATQIGVETGASLWERTKAMLSQGPTVLVLDNFETPFISDPTACEDLIQDLASLPSLNVVVTYRGNRPPGAAALWDASNSVRPLGEADARRLFLNVAGQQFAAAPELDLLLRELDGWPLAIDLVARQAAADSDLKSLWKRWETEKLELARAGKGDRPRDSVAVSLRLSTHGPLIGAEERRLLAVLGFLPAGITHNDLETLLPGRSHACAGRVRAAGLAFDEAERLRCLNPIRLHLETAFPLAAADREALLEHFLDLAALGARVGASGGAEAVSRLRPEVQNISTAMTGATAATSAGHLARAQRGYTEFARFTGLGSAAPLESLLPIHQEVGDRLGEANCIRSLGSIALERSDHDTAGKRFQEALPIYREVGDRLGEANCIIDLGNIALERSDNDTAGKHFQEALPIHKEAGDRLGEANCIRSLGTIALGRSDHDTAGKHFQGALPIYREVGDRLGEANCIRSLGSIALERSDHDTAGKRFQEALSIYREVGARLGEANCIQGLGNIALERSDYDTAGRRFQEALSIYQEIGNRLGEANCIRNLGSIALERSDHDTAGKRFQEALPIYREVGDRLGEANSIVCLGDVAQAQGKQEEARTRWRDALAIYQAISEPYSIGNTHLRLSRAATGKDIATHLVAARAAWRSIDRPDLIAKHIKG